MDPRGKSAIQTRCAYCFNLVAAKDAEMHHDSMHRLTEATRELPVLLIPGDPESCPHCQRNVAELTKTRQHILTCYRNKTRPKILCPICKLSFKTAFNVKLHVTRKHADRKESSHRPLIASDIKTQAFLDDVLPNRELYVLNNLTLLYLKVLGPVRRPIPLHSPPPANISPEWV
jgi:hypothetical protein